MRECMAAPAFPVLLANRRTQSDHHDNTRSHRVRFRELLNSRKKELAAISTSGHGKVLSDSSVGAPRGREVRLCVPQPARGPFTENASMKVDVPTPFACRSAKSPSSPRRW